MQVRLVHNWFGQCTSQALFIVYRETPLSRLGFFFVAETRCLPLLDDGFGCSSAQGNSVCKFPAPWGSSRLSLDICLQTGNSGWQMETGSKMNSSNQIRWAGTAFCRCVSFPFMYEYKLSSVTVAVSSRLGRSQSYMEWHFFWNSMVQFEKRTSLWK